MNITMFLFFVAYVAIGFLTLGVMVRYIFTGRNTPDPLIIVLFWPVAWFALLLCGACAALEEFCEFCRRGK